MAEVVRVYLKDSVMVQLEKDVLEEIEVVRVYQEMWEIELSVIQDNAKEIFFKLAWDVEK